MDDIAKIAAEQEERRRRMSLNPDLRRLYGQLAAANAKIAALESERDALREDLAWYADTFCEEGPYSEVCGRLSPDECSGCRARQALGAKP